MRMNAERRRAAILEAARKVFMRFGFAGARVVDIARAANVNEAILYRHFRSKRDMFEAAVAGPLEEAVRHTVDRAMEGLPRDESGAAGPQYETTRALYEELLTGFAEISPLLGAVLFEDRDEGARFYENRVLPAIQRLVEVIEKNWTTWPHREFDSHLVTTAAVGMCLGVAIDHSFRGVELDGRAVSHQITDLVFFGLVLPERGRSGSSRSSSARRPPRRGRRKRR